MPSYWIRQAERTHANNPGTFFLFFSVFHFSFFFFFSIPFILSSPFYSLSLLVVTQIRGHTAGSAPPLPATVRGLHFYHEKISALSSLVDSRRIVLTHARRSQQLVPFYSLQLHAKSHHGGTGTPEPPLLVVLIPVSYTHLTLPTICSV